MPTKWSEEDDIKLWSLRSKPVSQLSKRFNKTAGAIRSRLIHLQDPTHKAYQRRLKKSITSKALCDMMIEGQERMFMHIK